MQILKNIIVYSFLILNLCAESNYKYNLAVCAIFQNEARYLKEWIEFYKIIGVEHFYLYNNLSNDDYLKILSPYIQKGEIDLFDWNFTQRPGINNDVNFQIDAYNDALSKTNGVVKWLLVLDIDERLFPIHVNDLNVYLAQYEDKGYVYAQGLVFGTSNISQIPDNGCFIEYLNMCNPNHPYIGWWGKSIVRPERVYYGYGNPHFPILRSDYTAATPLRDELQMNHYWTLDMKGLIEHKIPSRVKWHAQNNQYDIIISMIEHIIKCERDLSLVKDTKIQKYVPLLKQRLFNNG